MLVGINTYKKKVNPAAMENIIRIKNLANRKLFRRASRTSDRQFSK
jgi:hypothetical protein